jgi:hypothetical protein
MRTTVCPKDDIETHFTSLGNLDAAMMDLEHAMMGGSVGYDKNVLVREAPR